MVQDSYFIINSNYLQNTKGFSSTATGIAFVYQGIGYVIASLIASRLIHNHSKKVILSGLSIMIVGLLLHLWVLDMTPLHPAYVHSLFFFYGIGCGSVLPSLMTLALRNLTPTLIGMGSSLYLTVQQLAICLGITFVVGIYYHSTEHSFFNFQHISGAYAYASIASIVLLIITGYTVIQQQKK